MEVLKRKIIIRYVFLNPGQVVQTDRASSPYIKVVGLTSGQATYQIYVSGGSHSCLLADSFEGTGVLQRTRNKRMCICMNREG